MELLRGPDKNPYYYVHNAPVLYTDSTGMYKTKNTSSAQDSEIRQAMIWILIVMARDLPCCVHDPYKIIHYITYDLTIEFKPQQVDCGYTPFLTGARIKHKIQLGPSAFAGGCCYKGNPLFSVATTILHELTHAVDHTGEPEAYDAEDKCFGCKRPPNQ